MTGTICVTCDNLGSALDVGAGRRAGPDPDDASIAIGLPRWLDALDRLDMRMTFCVEGWNALHHPEQVREIVDRGHEVACHGWVHEKFGEMSEIDAERVLLDAGAAFRNIGIVPHGFRAPHMYRGPYGVQLLEKLGYDYDMSVEDMSNQPMVVSRLGERLVNIPYRVNAIDYYYHTVLDPAWSPEATEAEWTTLVDECAENDGLVTFIFHPMVIGVYDAWLAMAERFLKKVKADPRLDVVTGAELADRAHRLLADNSKSSVLA